MSTHQFGISSQDLGGLVQTAVLSQGLEEVLGQWVDLANLGQQGSNTFRLGLTRHGRVLQEGLERLVFAHNGFQLLQVALNSLQRVLASGSGVQCRGVTTVQTVKRNWRLKDEVRY